MNTFSLGASAASLGAPLGKGGVRSVILRQPKENFKGRLTIYGMDRLRASITLTDRRIRKKDQDGGVEELLHFPNRGLGWHILRKTLEDNSYKDP